MDAVDMNITSIFKSVPALVKSARKNNNPMIGSNVVHEEFVPPRVLCAKNHFEGGVPVVGGDGKWYTSYTDNQVREEVDALKAERQRIDARRAEIELYAPCDER